jgi:hypothetical protein
VADLPASALGEVTPQNCHSSRVNFITTYENVSLALVHYCGTVDEILSLVWYQVHNRVRQASGVDTYLS